MQVRCLRPRGSPFANSCEGNGLNVVKVMPESAVKFGAFEVSFAQSCELASAYKLLGIETHVRQDRGSRQSQGHPHLVEIHGRRLRRNGFPVSASFFLFESRGHCY